MQLAFRCVVRNGIRRFQVADLVERPGRLRRVAVVARGRRRGDRDRADVLGERGAYTRTTPNAAAALADCAEMDRLYLKDPGGSDPGRRARARAALPAAAGEQPIELHSHCTIGLAPFVYMEGLRAGFRVLHTAVEPLARGTSNPAAETTLRNLQAEGFRTGSTWTRCRRRGPLPRTSHARRAAVGRPQEFDATYYHHQLAGGMVSTTRRMLEELRRPELFDAVLEEVGRVRAEMGYPIIVTPVSQLVATRRCATSSTASAGQTSPTRPSATSSGTTGSRSARGSEHRRAVLSRSRTEELRDLEPLHLEGARERFGSGSRTRSCCFG